MIGNSISLDSLGGSLYLNISITGILIASGGIYI